MTALAQHAADRNTLILEHVDMARRIARKVARRVPDTVRREELESAALLGLAESASRFDPHRGEPFVAFAAKRVRGAVLDELRRMDALTRRGRERARRIEDATREVEAESGQSATCQQVAARLGVSVKKLHRDTAALQAAYQVPFDDLRAETTAGDEPAADEQLERAQMKQLLKCALAALPERDLLILNMYYQDELTLSEIGDILGVSESRVSQLRTRALRALRKAVAG